MSGKPIVDDLMRHRRLTNWPVSAFRERQGRPRVEKVRILKGTPFRATPTIQHAFMHLGLETLLATETSSHYRSESQQWGVFGRKAAVRKAFYGATQRAIPQSLIQQGFPGITRVDIMNMIELFDESTNFLACNQVSPIPFDQITHPSRKSRR